MKICVIGNSHLAALKLGWDELANKYQNKIELVFFGSAKLKEEEVIVENDYLVPATDRVKDNFYNTSGGLAKIDFSDFDAVLLIGLHRNIQFLSRTLQTHCVYDAPALAQDTPYKIVSAGCLAQICIDQIKAAPMFQFVSLIRSVSKIPIFIAPTPLPSKACTRDGSGKWNFLALNACKTVQQSYYQSMYHLCRSFAVTLIPQSDNTVTDFLFTKEHLSQGSVRLSHHYSSLHEETDYGHMNKEYGIEILTSALQKIVQ